MSVFPVWTRGKCYENSTANATSVYIKAFDVDTKGQNWSAAEFADIAAFSCADERARGIPDCSLRKVYCEAQYHVGPTLCTQCESGNSVRSTLTPNTLHT